MPPARAKARSFVAGARHRVRGRACPGCRGRRSCVRPTPVAPQPARRPARCHDQDGEDHVVVGALRRSGRGRSSRSARNGTESVKPPLQDRPAGRGTAGAATPNAKVLTARQQAAHAERADADERGEPGGDQRREHERRPERAAASMPALMRRVSPQPMSTSMPRVNAGGEQRADAGERHLAERELARPSR